MAKLAPEWATRATHPEHPRDLQTVLSGRPVRHGRARLAFRTKRSELEARELLEHHRRIFPTFWAWSGRAVHEAILLGYIDLAFGWRIHHGTNTEGEDTAPPTLMNAPMQGNGAEMLRLAAIFAHRAGITINAPLHDALMIEAREEDVRDALATSAPAWAGLPTRCSTASRSA